MALGATECPAARQAARLTPLEAARAALALTAAPKSMPCREQERSEITRFVEEAVAAGEVLYIHTGEGAAGCCDLQPSMAAKRTGGK